MATAPYGGHEAHYSTPRPQSHFFTLTPATSRQVQVKKKKNAETQRKAQPSLPLVQSGSVLPSQCRQLHTHIWAPAPLFIIHPPIRPSVHPAFLPSTSFFFFLFLFFPSPPTTAAAAADRLSVRYHTLSLSPFLSLLPAQTITILLIRTHRTDVTSVYLLL